MLLDDTVRLEPHARINVCINESTGKSDYRISTNVLHFPSRQDKRLNKSTEAAAEADGVTEDRR
jgi:hypothetical protein